MVRRKFILTNEESGVKVIRPYADRSKSLTFVNSDPQEFELFDVSQEVYDDPVKWFSSWKVKAEELSASSIVIDKTPEDPSKVNPVIETEKDPRPYFTVRGDMFKSYVELTLDWVNVTSPEEIKVGSILYGFDNNKPILVGGSEYFKVTEQAQVIDGVITFSALPYLENIRKWNETKKSYHQRNRELKNK